MNGGPTKKANKLNYQPKNTKQILVQLDKIPMYKNNAIEIKDEYGTSAATAKSISAKQVLTGVQDSSRRRKMEQFDCSG